MGGYMNVGGGSHWTSCILPQRLSQFAAFELATLDKVCCIIAPQIVPYHDASACLRLDWGY